MDYVRTANTNRPKFLANSRLRKTLASKSRKISYPPPVPIAEKGESLPSSTPRRQESSIRIKPTLPQTYVKKHHYRPSFRPFSEEIIRFRPFYFTSDWLDRDLVNHRKEIANYVHAISELDKDGENSKVSAIICIQDRIYQVTQAMNYTNLPPSTARVQWRQSFTNRQPSLFLLFILLNRFGKVVALMRVTPNSAICVYESLACVERAVNNVCEKQGKRLLIISWWYTALQNRTERRKINDDAAQTANWLIQHHDTPIIPLPEISSDHVLFDKPAKSSASEYHNPEGFKLTFQPHHSMRTLVPKMSMSTTAITRGYLSPGDAQ